MIQIRGLRDDTYAWRLFVYARRIITLTVAKNGSLYHDFDHRTLGSAEVSLFRSRQLGARVRFDDEHGTTFSFHLPFLLSVYVSLSFLRFPRLDGQYTGLSLSFDGEGMVCRDVALYVEPWCDSGWERGRSWWRNGWSVRLLDVMFGRPKHDGRVIYADDRPLFFPDSEPEGTMPCTVELAVSTWTRPRWPRWPLRVCLLRATIKPDTPLPLVYKADNLHESTFPLRNTTISEAEAFPALAATDACNEFIANLLSIRKRGRK